MASKFFDRIEVSPEARQFVERSFLIADQIKHSLRTQGLTQRDLADRLGKKEPEVSRMLSGTHNFTLKTLIRLEQALGAQIFTTPQEVQKTAAAFTLHDTVSVEEFDTADWHKVTSMFPVKEATPARESSRSSRANVKKAAGAPAAFFILEEVA